LKGKGLFIVLLTNSMEESPSGQTIGIVGGGVQLGPFGTAATNRPIVPAPGDYDMEKLVEWLALKTELLGEHVPHLWITL
jgi:hypothetical protein